jgi:outer membrane protein
LKKTLLIAVCAICFFSLSAGAYAEDGRAWKFGVGAEVSFLKTLNYDVDDVVDTEQTFDGAAMPGVNMTFFFNQYFSTELTLAYAKYEMELDVPGAKIEQGELEQVPLLLTFRAHMPSEGGFSPYIGAGLSYFFNDFDMSDFYSRNLAKGTSIDPDDGLGFHANLGVEIDVTDNLSFDIDGKYTWYEEEFLIRSPGRRDREEDVELNSFSIGAGMKVYF